MTTALYRRYRPETFAEVVGQDHVTGPLRQALRSGQINHAYLFSGPRGCGKTTSARILARCLNCAEGPTDTPCGVCPSCVELARGGPGSLDVVEIDAASHGGVDDARDLRERATFAPARDRYKVFILDEAHMVSPQGFNALLKIVEEPPEHVKFIFATTEPDKVIGTIRSRTHHYPFRLVPPEIMTDYLGQICGTEQITVGSGVLPLVVRAGGGSVRDSLSVLDQLIAGSGPEGLVYEDAVALLGYTHASLLDDLVDAIAARDGASAFRVVERVISTGHEPRRFVEDLLERLRDLIVLQASGEAADAVLRDIPGDQLARMRTQAQHLGASELSRSADLANAALTEMSGATSPRLHLELLMARLLLPAMDDSAAGLGARVDRLERTGVGAGGGSPVPVVQPVIPVERVAVVTAPTSPDATSSPETAASGAALARAAMAAAGRPGGAEPTAPAADPVATPAPAPQQPIAVVEPERAAASSDTPPVAAASEHADDERPAPGDVGDERSSSEDAHDERSAPVEESAAPSVEQPVAAVPVATPDAGPTIRSDEPVAVVRPMSPDPVTTSAGSVTEEPSTATDPVAATASVPAGGAPADPGPAPTARTGAGQDTEMLRRRWPEVLETLAGLKKTTWVLISQNAQVIELDATTLRLGFTAPGLATAFRGGQHAELVHQAVRETLGFDVRVEGVLAGDGPAAPPAAARPDPAPATTGATEAGESRPSVAPREHDSAPAARPGESADDDAPADPWAQAAPAIADERAGTDGSDDPAPSTAAEAQWPEVAPIPGSSTPDSTAASDSAHRSDSSADADWPTVAPIPGSSQADPAPASHGGDGHVGAAATSDGWPSAEASPEVSAGSRDTDAGEPAVDRTAAEGHGDLDGARADRPAEPAVDRPTRPHDADRPARSHDAEPPHADEPPPPWDDPEDPGMPEPPEDPWAGQSATRAVPAVAGRATPVPAPTTTTASSAEATRSPRPDAPTRSVPAAGAPLSGADRVRAAMIREPVTVTPTRSGGPNWADDEPSMDDPDISASGMAGVQLVAQALGGVVIEEQIDDQ